MKLLKYFAIILIALLAACSGTETPEFYKMVKYDTSLDCHKCEKKIMTNLPHEDGIVAIKVDVPGKTVTVTFDPQETDENKIASALNDIGYMATILDIKEVKS